MSISDRLGRAVLKSKSGIPMDTYKQTPNRANSLNSQLEAKYFSAKISECKGIMKKSWKTGLLQEKFLQRVLS